LRKRVILLLSLLALFAFVATAEAADVAPPVEGEAMDVRPTGTSVVTDTTLYSNGRALKFSNSTAVAKETVSFASSGDVVLMARASQRGGSPKLAVSVNGTFAAPAQAITNSGAPAPYTFDVNAPSGSVTIGVKASNTGLGRYPFLDVLSFPASITSEVLVGAGDISSSGTRDQQTGDLVRAQLDGGAWGVFTTGDSAYPNGTYENYLVYDAAWGSFRSKTRPAYGNHDYYGSPTAVGSEQYWNEAPDPTPVRVSNANSFYAYDAGNSNWRAIVLNSVSTEGPTGNQAPSCAAGSPQMTFLNSELNTTKNTVLFWHHARFSASADHPTSEGATGCSKAFFDAAHDNGADLVLEGHSHLYERYGTRDKTGTKVAGGLTSVVCGTGGNSFDALQASPSPAPDRAFTNAWGVCKLTLNADNARVDFLPAPGSPGTDGATVSVRP
jgi:hypothetical protein